MTKTIWVDTTGASTTYVPREKPIQESVAPFSGTISGAAPATTNLGTNSGQRILAADGTWIPQPAFTSGGADQLETLRPSVISTSYSANPPTVTDSAKAYDVDTNHATTFGQWYAAQEARTNNRVDIFSLTTWASKTQTWTAATINVSRSYAILQDGESSATSGSSSKTSSVKYEFSTNNGSNWTTLGTDTQSSIPTAPQTLSMALGTLTPTMGNILIKVTITRGGGGTIYEDGVSLPGLTGEVDLKLFDVWIDGTYAGGAGNITCNNLTVTGDATFQNKIYDSTASSGTTGQVLKVAANGKITWATDTVGTGTVTSVAASVPSFLSISGSPITTSGTLAISYSGTALPVANGGSGQTTAQSAMNTFAGAVTSGSYLRGNGTNVVMSTIQAADVPTLNQNTTGSAGSVANALTITSPLTGTSFNGSAAVSIGIPAATSSVSGYLTSTDWTTFNNKGSGTVTSVAASVPSFLSVTGSPITSSGTLAITYSGTALPVANGGTGLTTLTAGYIPYGNGTSAFGSSANLFWDSSNSYLGIGTSSPSTKLEVSGVGTFTAGSQETYGSSGLSFGASRLMRQMEGTSVAREYICGADTSTYGSYEFYTAKSNGSPTLAYAVSSSGNVGIGTTATTPKLNVALGTGYSTGASWGTNVATFGQATGIAGGALALSFDTTSGSILTSVNPGISWYPLTLSGSQVLFYNNGSEQMRLNSTGLGIGTASPSEKLTVAAGSGSNAFGLFYGGSGGTLGGIKLGNAGTSYSTLYFDNATNNLVLYQQYTSGSLLFGTNNTERMRITSGGDVLVNATATADSSKLYVAGNLGTNGSQFNFRPGSGTQYELVNRVGAGFDFYVNNAGTLAARLDASGNLGLGTSSPLGRLDVRAAVGSSPDSTIQNIVAIDTTSYGSGNGGGIGFGFVFNSGGSVIGRAAVIKGIKENATDGNYASALTFSTTQNSASTTERMRITSGGEVLIGNTNGTEKLTVTGNIRASGVYVGNGSTGDWNKGFGGIKLTTTTSTPTGGQSGDFVFIY